MLGGTRRRRMLTSCAWPWGGVWFFLRQDWLPGALTTVCTIAEGMGIRWVMTRCTEAKEEEENAYQDVKEVCSDAEVAEADKLRLIKRRVWW